MDYKNNKNIRLNVGKIYEIKIMNIINNYFHDIKCTRKCIENNNKNKYNVDLKILDQNNKTIAYVECKHIHNPGNRLYISQLNGEQTGPNKLFEYAYMAEQEGVSLWYVIYDEYRGYVYISTYNKGLKKLLEITKNSFCNNPYGNIYFQEKDFNLQLKID